MFPAKMEFGQGTWTGYRQIVAEELDVEVTQHQDPDLGHRVGESVPEQPDELDRRRATARHRAARRSGARPPRRGARCSTSPRPSSACRVASLTVDKGVVSGGGKTVTYGQLLGGKVFNTTIATTTNLAPIKPMSSYKVVGTRVPRFDIPDKVTGKHVYVQNVRVPGMLHGRVVRPRGQANFFARRRRRGLRGFTVLSVDESSIANIDGREGRAQGELRRRRRADRVRRDPGRGAAEGQVVGDGHAAGHAATSTARSARATTRDRRRPELRRRRHGAQVGGQGRVGRRYEFGRTRSTARSGRRCAIADVHARRGDDVRARPGRLGSCARAARRSPASRSTASASIDFEGASTYNRIPNCPRWRRAASCRSSPASRCACSRCAGTTTAGSTSARQRRRDPRRAGRDREDRRLRLHDVAAVSTRRPTRPTIQTDAIPLPADATTGASVRGAPDRFPGITSANPASTGARVETFSSGDQYIPNIPNRRVSARRCRRMFTRLTAAGAVVHPAGVGLGVDDGRARLRGEHGSVRVPAAAHARTMAGAACWTRGQGARSGSRSVSASKLSNERFVTGRGISIAGENHANDDVHARCRRRHRGRPQDREDHRQAPLRCPGLRRRRQPGVVDNQLNGMLVTRRRAGRCSRGRTFSKKRRHGLDWVDAIRSCGSGTRRT